LRELLHAKQIVDEQGNVLTERSGVIEEFLHSGFWNGLPAFIQKAIVEFKPLQKQKPQEIPEPSGWREFLEQNYDTENEKLQLYLLKGWKSIPQWFQRDIVFEMAQKK